MPRFVGAPALPTVSTLPVGAAGQQVMYGGFPYFHDGTKWNYGGPPSVKWGTAKVGFTVGPVPVPEFTYNVYLGDITATSIVMGTLSQTASGKDPDELEMDVVDIWCKGYNTGYVDIRLTGQTGFIADFFTVDLIYTKAN